MADAVAGKKNHSLPDSLPVIYLSEGLPKGVVTDTGLTLSMPSILYNPLPR